MIHKRMMTNMIIGASVLVVSSIGINQFIDAQGNARPTHTVHRSVHKAVKKASSSLSSSSTSSTASSSSSLSEQPATPVASSAVAEPTPAPAPVTDQAPTDTAQSEVTPTSNPAPDTSGFNMLGQHFPIGSFAGTGQVPADNMVYRWASDSRWFLIEQAGQAGQIVQGVGMGAPITVDGHTYHVTDIQHGIPNNGDAGRYYLAHINQHAIGFQTCDTYGILSLWFAD